MRFRLNLVWFDTWGIGCREDDDGDDSREEAVELQLLKLLCPIIFKVVQ